MAVAREQPAAEDAPPRPWLLSPRWDMSFIVLSVVVALLPYSIYLFVGRGGVADASTPGTAAYQARVAVNLLVALLFGGPHMYATFTRTLMDPEFRRKRAAFIATSMLVPVIVVLAATWSYNSYIWLLSAFFSVASVHALHQLVWVTEAYNRRSGFTHSLPSRLIDYGVVLSSLYPIAVWKMTHRTFRIGPILLKHNEILGGAYWLAYLTAGVFAVMLVAFAVKTVAEFRLGQFNLPKTLLIGATCLLMFWTPAFPNMDTAFQGVNTWHSFQYLALTWYANRLREQRSGRRLRFLHAIDDLWTRARLRPGAGGAPAGLFAGLWAAVTGGLRRFDAGTGWSTFYLLCMAMLPVSGLLILGARFFWPHLYGDLPGADEAYTYMGILSVLLVHYVHDALLFTDYDALVQGAPPAAIALPVAVPARA